MNSWLMWAVWGAFAFVAALLVFVGRHFTVRTLRWVTAVTAAVLVVLITRYGLTHPVNPANASSDLANAFRQGADELGAAFFHPLLSVLPGNQDPAPGRVGWIVIAVLLVIGYRMLEAWTMRREAPALDTSALDGQPNGASSKTEGSGKDLEDYDKLVARIKFQLSAIEVRSPAILPGGTKSNGLASIAEASGVTGGDLAGAIIRVFGMLWPKSRRFQVRVRMESVPQGGPQGPGSRKVTVSLDEPATGQSVATKTIAADNLDEAAAVVAGYVASQIFSQDPTTPPWCYGAANGRDLAAMLLAKQERVHGKSAKDICGARSDQIDILKKATGINQCAGVVRYELAQLYDLEGKYLKALRLHAVNREQHPRFYRGRYRLSMSLEMIANSTFPLRDKDIDWLYESLTILNRCGVTRHVKRQDDFVHGRLQPGLRKELLVAAGNELSAIRKQLTLRHVIWGTFRHRDERLIRTPHWSLRKRQSFHDGLCVAELLVAVRRSLNEEEPFGVTRKPRHVKLALRLAADIADDDVSIEQHLTKREAQCTLEPQSTPESSGRKFLPAEKRNRTRWLPWQARTPSWEAAYNTACAYAVLNLEHRVVISLHRAINNPDCEMQRPWDWISHDPDFFCLDPSEEFTKFLKIQEKRDYPMAVHCPVRSNGNGRAAGARHIKQLT